MQAAPTTPTTESNDGVYGFGLQSLKLSDSDVASTDEDTPLLTRVNSFLSSSGLEIDLGASNKEITEVLEKDENLLRRFCVTHNFDTSTLTLKTTTKPHATMAAELTFLIVSKAKALQAEKGVHLKRFLISGTTRQVLPATPDTGAGAVVKDPNGSFLPELPRVDHDSVVGYRDDTHRRMPTVTIEIALSEAQRGHSRDSLLWLTPDRNLRYPTNAVILVTIAGEKATDVAPRLDLKIVARIGVISNKFTKLGRPSARAEILPYETISETSFLAGEAPRNGLSLPLCSFYYPDHLPPGTDGSWVVHLGADELREVGENVLFAWQLYKNGG